MTSVDESGSDPLDRTDRNAGPRHRLPTVVVLVILLGVNIGVQYFQSALRILAFDTSWYGVAERAPWHPPDTAVVVLWTATLLATALGTWLTWRENERGRAVLVLFAVQALLNASWPLAIFALFPALGTASTWLGLVILLLLALAVIASIRVARPLHRAAVALFGIALAWVLYACTLVVALALLN